MDTLKIDQLILDPNNYRFLDMKDFIKVDEKRYHEDKVQERVWELIKNDGIDELRALKESIQTNGYVPIESMIVRPYEHKDGLYIVVEGNRRLAAMRWLKRDSEAGAQVSDELIESFDKIPVITLDPNKPDYENIQHVMMGIRHVSGIKQWGGYQRAKLIVELVDYYSYPIADAAKKIGMSSHESTRRYRAFKALEQMQNDEEFGSYAEPRMYRLFHEAVAQPKVREWLDWDEEKLEFTNDEHKREFYKLLIPHRIDDDDDDGFGENSTIDPKIKSYKDVRLLKDILGDIDAEESLLDSEQTLSDALAIAKLPAGTNWLPKVKSASKALETIPVDILKKLTRDEIEPIFILYKELKERLEDWMKLTDSKLDL